MKKCRDCGEKKESRMEHFRGRGIEGIVRERSSRPDVCDECWDARGRLIKAVESGEISHEAFTKAQKGMKPGRTRRAIDAAFAD